MLMPDVTRIEIIIGGVGRAYTWFGTVGVEELIQDEGRTLKLFFDVDETLAAQVQEDIKAGLSAWFAEQAGP